MAAEQRKLDVVEREQAIFRYLRGIDRERGATVRELHEQLTITGAAAQPGGKVRDTVTVQAYHKLVTRLVLDGRLVEVGDPGAEGPALRARARAARRQRADPRRHRPDRLRAQAHRGDRRPDRRA